MSESEDLPKNFDELMVIPSSPIAFLSNSFGISTMQETQLSGRIMRRHSELVRSERQEQINLFTGHPHRRYYGYAVSLDWLIESMEKHWPVALPAPDARNYRIIARRRAFEFIGQRTGINLDWQICFNPKGDSVPPEWFASMYGEIDDPKDMEIVTVITVCSDEDCDFERRPSQDRVDSMTNLIRRVPHWWTSSGTKTTRGKRWHASAAGMKSPSSSIMPAPSASVVKTSAMTTSTSAAKHATATMMNLRLQKLLVPGWQ
ncbi:hypothetical protein AZE42_06188 [Rhizopogon vesiculosus]|uniref:Uncharacterized protein n=1 Tax=Rhizopogon vesiculosus TaxID=180088 RepID=A0A1J8QAW1_9AGAM|nr:hypothetical protein AZE42_06188 [Rhizopogon vesiculosus]